MAKAFDTVDHAILLSKLNFYGIHEIPQQWFADYLTNRKQFVCINNSNSSLSYISCGVPQCSILGPILFLIYINDLNNVSKKLRSIVFADDTNLFMTGKSITEIETKMNIELDLLVEWFRTNLLPLNITKTNYNIFSKKRRVNANILIGNTTLVQVE